MESDFERLYADFLRRGGFAQPCISEDYERVRGPRVASTVAVKCKHGLTDQTCAYCYFERYGPKG